MKNLMGLLIAFLWLGTASCEKSATSPDATTSQKGIVKGKVTDTKGSPIANAKVVIENTVFYANYVYATTNAEGNYSASVPNGSWKASVQIERQFEGLNYKFDLCPDNDNPFAGTDGAVRNFTWKLAGARPGGNGYFGGNVLLYTEPGSPFNAGDVELTLTPVGPLVDGSQGQSITASLQDVGGGEDGVPNVPLGKYKITAINKVTDQPLQVRLRNTGEYGPSITTVFKSGFTGVTSYQVVAQVK
jgi:hypothetical protein